MGRRRHHRARARSPTSRATRRSSRCADILGTEDVPAADYRAVSRVTFTDPEVGSVGLTEAQARATQGLRVRSPPPTWSGPAAAGSTARAPPAWSSWSPTSTATSWWAPPWSRRTAARCSACSSTAVHAEVPLPVLRRMHFAYPTFHRAIQVALGGTCDRRSGCRPGTVGCRRTPDRGRSRDTHGGPMPDSPQHLADDTSDRLYTPEELAAFAAQPTGRTRRRDPLPTPTTTPRSTTPAATDAGPGCHPRADAEPISAAGRSGAGPASHRRRRRPRPSAGRARRRRPTAEPGEPEVPRGS